MDDMETTTDKPKRKRGRPKGSKTKKRTVLVVEDVAPAPATSSPTVVYRTVRGSDPVQVTIAVPLVDRGDGYGTSRVDISRLTTRQTDTLARLFTALNETHALLATGRHVETSQDAVRWLLDEIDRQLGG